MKKLLIKLVMLTNLTPALAEGQVSLSTGFDFSSGKYGGTASTDILYIPVTGKYETDNLTLKLTVPYIRITGPGGVVQGVGPIVQTMGPAKTVDSGLGDIVAWAGYNVYSGGTRAFDVVGKIKFGTADANKGLGTGLNSYSAQLDGYDTFGKTTFFVTAGYRIYETSTAIILNNVPYGTLGASHKLGNASSAGVMLDVAQSPSATSSGQREVTGFISHKVSSSFKVQANVMKGFSSGSPDFGYGAMITSYF